jgi:hypothetical protein
MNGTNAKVKSVSTEHGQLTLSLDDGRVVSAPLSWYPSLAQASAAERNEWQLSGAGHGVHWPALDYDLSVEGLLEGRREHPSALQHTHEVRSGRKPSRKAPARGKGGRSRKRAAPTSA